MTTSGVQTYAISTNDLLQPNPAPGIAYGLQPATGGLADLRVKRDATGLTSGVTLLLSKFGLSWDGTTERPLVIETFETKQGRVQLNSAGIATLLPLPPPTDINLSTTPSKAPLAHKPTMQTMCISRATNRCAAQQTTQIALRLNPLANM